MKEIHIYVYGLASKTGLGGYNVSLVYNELSKDILSVSKASYTSSRVALNGLLKALRAVKPTKEGNSIVVHTKDTYIVESQYKLNYWATNNLTETEDVYNMDLWHEIIHFSKHTPIAFVLDTDSKYLISCRDKLVLEVKRQLIPQLQFK